MRFFVTIALTSILFGFKIRYLFADDADLQKNTYYDKDLETFEEQRRKKPFCNAFTGCGRKRSDDSASAVAASLMELNPDLTLQELIGPVSSEAKLWDALREARLEALSRKTKEIQPSLQIEPLYSIYRFGKKRCRLGSYFC